MLGSKIPIWENGSDYPPEIEDLAISLLTLADSEYQMRVWVGAKGLEADWYDENSLNFDTSIEFFKDGIRRKKFNLTKEQIKAILRVHAMCLHFSRLIEPIEMPDDWRAFHLCLINQPYWQKIRQQAERALSLIKLPESQNK